MFYIGSDFKQIIIENGLTQSEFPQDDLLPLSSKVERRFTMKLTKTQTPQHFKLRAMESCQTSSGYQGAIVVYNTNEYNNATELMYALSLP